MKKYNLQSLVAPPATESQKSSKKAEANLKAPRDATSDDSQTTVSRPTADTSECKGTDDHNSPTTVGTADTSDCKDTADRIDAAGDHDIHTTVRAADTSDHEDTADKTDAGDQSSKIADTASDHDVTTIDDGVKTAVSDTIDR